MSSSTHRSVVEGDDLVLGSASFVGRARELSSLSSALDDVVSSGEARIVTVVGAPGLGKARLVAEFLAAAAVVPEGRVAPRILRAKARPQGGTYDVFSRLLRTRFEIPYGTPDGVASDRLRGAVHALLGDRQVGDVLHFLGPLVDLRFPGSPLVAAIEDDPVQLRALRRAVLRRVIEADAASPSRRGTSIIVLEDLHYLGGDALELFETIAGHVRAPVLFVATGRPELLAARPSFRAAGGERHRLVELGPLAEADATRLAEQLLAPASTLDEPVPGPLVEKLVEIGRGSPALLARSVRALFDAGVLRAEEIPTDDPDLVEERWRFDPDRLPAVRPSRGGEGAVDARLAALSREERSVLERAALIGSTFWASCVVALGRVDRTPPELFDPDAADDVPAIECVLRDLVARGYLVTAREPTFPGEEEFSFRSEHERSVLEQRVPAGTAQRFHHAIGEWLSFREGVREHEAHVARLAHHLERAGIRGRAAAVYIEAGDVARARYANAKALDCFARGLDLLGQDDARLRLHAFHQYGDVLSTAGRDEEALVQFRAMADLAWSLGLDAKAGAAHNRIGRIYRESGRLDEAARHLAIGLRLFQRAGDERGVASSLDDVGKLAWMRGDYRAALGDLRKALATRKRLGDRRSIALSLNNLGLVLQDSGHFKEALEAFEQALRIRREIGDLVGVVTTLNNLGTVAQDQRDDARAMGLFQEALELAREIGDRHKLVLVLTNVGETWYRMGDLARALEVLLESETLADEIGDRMLLAEAMRGLGKAHLLRGDLEKARDYTERALELFERVRSKVQIGVALRTLGEVAAAEERLGPAKGYFERSIALFHECGNEVELARTYRAYAELLRRGGQAASDPRVALEIAEYTRRAEDVLAKIRISAIGIDPSAFFS
jgi:tetratricopeptide (TPR) repeat protein